MNTAALYRVTQVRAIERAAQASLPPSCLMQRAGAAVAAATKRLLQAGGQSGPVLVIAGPGNNGGDALVAAASLAQDGLPVSICMLGAATLSAEASAALAHAQTSGAVFISPQQVLTCRHWQLVVDGLFGIGLTRPIEGQPRELVECINTLVSPVLAIDVPSGLDADTGCMVGPDGVAIRATLTLSFIANKPGLHTADGRDCAGLVEVDDLQIDADLYGAPAAWLNQPELFVHAAKKRRHASNKGTYGDLAVVGGDDGMTGAVVLAARMALMAGAGRVFAGFIGTPPAYDPPHPELMCRAAPTLDRVRGTFLAGPGLGMSRNAEALLAQLLSSRRPLVLDADALNLIAVEPALQTKLATRRSSSLLTPHPLEAARLRGCRSETVQSDRLATALALATQYQSVVILKGSGSVIAHPDGRMIINPTGNPALATAGSGDVLAGLCGALLAQGWPNWEAALAATWLHGAAADRLVAHGNGPIGLTASGLMPAIRAALNELLR